MQIGKIVVIEPTDILILKSECRMRPETREKQERYFKEHWGINVKILDGVYDIVEVETNG